MSCIGMLSLSGLTLPFYHASRDICIFFDLFAGDFAAVNRLLADTNVRVECLDEVSLLVKNQNQNSVR